MPSSDAPSTLPGTNRTGPDGAAAPAYSLAEVPWHRLPPEIPRLMRKLADERARLEKEAEARLTQRMEAADAAFREGSQRREARWTSETSEARSTHLSTRTAAIRGFEADTQRVKDHYQTTRRAILTRARSKKEEADQRLDRIRWEATALFEANSKGETERYEQFGKDLAAEVASLEQVKVDAEATLAAYRKYRATAGHEPVVDLRRPDDPLEALRQTITRADQTLVAIESLQVPRSLTGGGVVWLFVLPWLLLVIPAIYFLSVQNGLIACTVAAITLGLVLRYWLYGVARRSLGELQPSLRQAIAEAEALVPIARTWGDEVHQRRVREIAEQRATEVSKAERTHAVSSSEIEESREASLMELEQTTQRQLGELEDRRSRAVSEADETLTRRQAEIEAESNAEASRLDDERQRRRQDATERHRKDRETFTNLWQSGMDEIRRAVGEIEEQSSRRFPSWARGNGRVWNPAEEVPPAVRFGEVRIDLDAIPHGVPSDPDLRAMAPESVRLPALLTFPDRGSLLIEYPSAGRDAAMASLRGAMARFLTGLPPGKVRFTIIDPVGLGRNFAAFMHLADYSELLINSRIWTEPQQIEQRLADLSLHMENVIQHYLRNEYPTLDEYNRHAGEVAEPYRVLVVADFPANFHDQSAQRLLSIATSGARCGVYTLIAVDTDQPLPQNVRLDELEAHAATLRWEKDRLAWKDRDFGPFPLALDTPPDEDRFTRLLQEVGEAARHANRVEVPFEVVAPPRESWWKGDTRSGVDIPLGRAGATKLQHLMLGRGTSQHVLIAGRTGSGKSTLLHALITNAALIYSPNEVELYLIDFKKGVEFKTYAQHALPHARVVAIESEREFGLSVLQRLDEELKRRGDRFRELNVQDLNGYRGVPDAPPLPRVLLIVDEFQEFFVEDDKTAQEAALLLDRLVRQGRAFGVHVHLGSQTLSGAYSLARSTLGQMGVRIALQCSDTDAHLILSEDNAAARLLTRPGEAIYNDANGMVEGNHVFQVVWLPDERKEHYLKQIKTFARERGLEMPRPQIVFEGNIPSDLSKNHLLREVLESSGPVEAAKAPRAWLGEAVAIKDPTAAVFRRMGGNNVLVLGQDNDAARGIFVASILSLAAQYGKDAARFYLLDGTPEDDSGAGSFEVLRDVLPHPLRLGNFAETGAILGELGEELVRRQEGAGGAPSVFLFIYDMSRFRDLRKQEDDYGFGFGKREEERTLTPAQHLGELIKEGPALGMHATVWFDTLNNVNRSLDRQGLREFEMRVLFQMSANDSSLLIDSPVANRLGPNRALYASEEQGSLEKFRPYGMPDREWLNWVGERLRARSES